MNDVWMNFSFSYLSNFFILKIENAGIDEIRKMAKMYWILVKIWPINNCNYVCNLVTLKCTNWKIGVWFWSQNYLEEKE